MRHVSLLRSVTLACNSYINPNFLNNVFAIILIDPDGEEKAGNFA